MENKTMRIGGWILEWNPARRNTVWAIPEKLKGFKRSDSGILYTNKTMAWDLPESTPPYVRKAALAFILECQNERVTQ